MTKEEIIVQYVETCHMIDGLANQRDHARTQANAYEEERQKWARRRYAWASIYLNLFDEEMPELIREDAVPIYGKTPLTVEDVINIKEES